MCSLAFWSQSFAELKARSGSSFVGVVVLAVETAAVVLAVELLAAASPQGGRKKEPCLRNFDAIDEAN